MYHFSEELKSFYFGTFWQCHYAFFFNFTNSTNTLIFKSDKNDTFSSPRLTCEINFEWSLRALVLILLYPIWNYYALSNNLRNKEWWKVLLYLFTAVFTWLSPCQSLEPSKRNKTCLATGMMKSKNAFFKKSGIRTWAGWHLWHLTWYCLCPFHCRNHLPPA